ncbi:uncharacterized protein LOC144146106 isoform X2 [Haemaphysalis longicornis]
MYSLTKPPMNDKKLQAAVARARSANGVHLYFDEPHTKKHKTYKTPLANWGNTKFADLTWTTVCFATEDRGSCALRISNTKDDLRLEYGVEENDGWHYANRYDGSWPWPQPNFIQRKLKKNEYVVFTAHLKHVNATKGLTVTFEFGGERQSQEIKYKENQDFSTFGTKLFQHDKNCYNVQILEIHFLYTGITEGLPARDPAKGYISFQTAELCAMRAGNTAVIVGRYYAYNSNHDGILIGVGSSQGSKFHDFTSYRNSKHAVTFRVQLGFFGDVSLTSEKEEQTLALNFDTDEPVWLLVENIQILNLEIDMYSLTKPPMNDKKLQAAVARARSANGVHLYFDEPHTKKDKTYNTPLPNWGNTKSSNLTWTTVCCAAEDGASFGLRISNPHHYLRLEYGVNEYTYHYANGYEKGYWLNQKDFFPRKLKKNEYVVFTAHLKYVNADKKLTVTFEVGGDVSKEEIIYSPNQDFSTLGTHFKQHEDNFQNVQLLEIHFLYTGITEGLPARGPANQYISFQTAELCAMRAGNTAVIVGRYYAYNTNRDGILIGVGSSQGSTFHDFTSYRNSKHAVTFRVQLGFFGDVSLSSEKEEQKLTLNFDTDEPVWLLVENIQILNLEIHSTLENR